MDLIPPCSEQTGTYFGWEQLNSNSRAVRIAPKVPINAMAEIIKALLSIHYQRWVMVPVKDGACSAYASDGIGPFKPGYGTPAPISVNLPA